MTGTAESCSSSTDSKEQKSNVEQPSLRTFLHKNTLLDPDSQTFDEICNFIQDKLDLGNGETLYHLGENDVSLTEEELAKCIETLAKVCEKLDADYLHLNGKNEQRVGSALFSIRKKVAEEDFKEVRVAVLGNVDAGKSTLLSVLTHGALDDGRGLARQKLFRHKHEIESGRTSSVGNDILGFDSKGKIVNRPSAHNNNLNWSDICERSSKLISFIDLCGHDSYLKTTIFGMTAMIPNYCMLLVGGNTGGVIGSTKEHLGLSLALKVPLFVIVTKIDSTPPNVLSSTLEISCVTGQNLDLLKAFLNLLSPKFERQLDDQPTEFQIDETYTVPVGTVVSGLVMKGVIRTNDVLYLGPSKLNKFEPVMIKSIHRKRMPVREAHSGQSASLALKKVKRSDVRKGMVMLSTSLEPKAYQEFYAEILILHHPTTISKNYQAVIHCGSIRQTATIINMDKECLRTGDKAKVHLRFIKNPEYIKPNQNIVFRESKTKAIGKVLSVISDTATSSTSTGQASLGHKKMKRLIYQSKKEDHTKKEDHPPSSETNENDLNLKNKTNKN